MEGKIVIIDGNSLMNRAYYAMQRPMMTRDGVYTQGIYGFLNMLNKIENDYDPDYMLVAWDRKTPTFRHKEYSDYKAGRHKMPPELAMEFPLIKEILEAMRIKQLEIDGFEADDIIGTVARDGEEAGLKPLIITGDKDALQLATDITKVLITKKGISEFDLYDRDKMKERYELTPEQFIDLKGLMGDQSDNIPGIPGIGEKTGIKLLKEFGSVAELIARTDEIKQDKLREKIEDNAELAVMSRRLATIITNVPLDYDLAECRVEEPDTGKLVEIYSRLELNSFLRKFHVEAGSVQSEAENKAASDHTRSLLETGDLDRLAPDADKDLFIHVFGNNDHVNRPVIYGIALLQEKNYWYVPVKEDGDVNLILERIGSCREKLCGHGLASSLYMLYMNGAEDLKAAFDTEVAAYVLDPSRSGYELKVLALEEFHEDIESDKEFSQKVAQTSLLDNNDSAFSDRGYDILRLSQAFMDIQKRKLASDDMENVMYDIEMPLVSVLAEMECAGIKVDKSMLADTGEELSKEIDRLTSEIYGLAGEEFNINSPKQLGDILFDKLELPSGKKTKSGFSTSADILEKIKDKHEIVPKVLEYRTLSKLKSTYVEGLMPLISPEGKVHCHFQQTVAATGRLSCTEPNLQNIPVRQELGRTLRKAFVAGDGCLFVGADYSQIELRLMAHLSGDENLIDAFNNGEDIHRKTASRVFNIDYDKVTKLDRSKAKAVNFGIIYGMSSFGLSQDIHVSRKEAEEYIKEYFAKHVKVKEYLDEQVKLCKERGYTLTFMGRRRYVNEIGSSNYMVRQLGERLAMNSPIQGSAADIIKIAMIKVADDLKKKGLKSRLILQIHDELIIETYKDELEEVEKILMSDMESAAELKVSLTCDMNSAENWYDLK